MTKKVKATAKKKAKPPRKYVYVLRTCLADLTSPSPDAYGFRWKVKGVVKCDDWDSGYRCGNGLHGLLDGKGDGSLLCWDADAKWLVVKVPEDTIVNLRDKVKFPSGEVVYCGDRQGATEFLAAQGLTDVVGGILAVGDNRQGVVGEYATLAGGRRSTLEASYSSQVVADRESTVSVGDNCRVTAGNMATVKAGGCSSVLVNNYATATVGNDCRVMAAAHCAITAGTGCRIMAEYGTKVRAGAGTWIGIETWVSSGHWLATGKVGRGKIKADTWYEAVGGKLREVALDAIPTV